MKESMRVVTESGVVEITLCANHEDNMKNLREEMFNWFEDFVEREMSDGRPVSTTNSPVWEFNAKRELNSIYGKKCEHFDVDIEKIVDHINEIRDSARGYKTRNTRCGWVTEVPWEFENFQALLDAIIEALTPF